MSAKPIHSKCECGQPSELVMTADEWRKVHGLHNGCARCRQIEHTQRWEALRAKTEGVSEKMERIPDGTLKAINRACDRFLESRGLKDPRQRKFVFGKAA